MLLIKLLLILGCAAYFLLSEILPDRLTPKKVDRYAALLLIVATYVVTRGGLEWLVYLLVACGIAIWLPVSIGDKPPFAWVRAWLIRRQQRQPAK